MREKVGWGGKGKERDRQRDMQRQREREKGVREEEMICGLVSV